MRNLSKICVGTDFSREAEAAIHCAATLARTYKAQMDLVHVVVPLARYSLAGAASTAGARLIDEAANRALERLQKLAASPILSGMPAVCQVRIGVPFSELISHARENGDDLIVVGNTPASGMRQWFLGGTTERVLRKATVPVLVGKEGIEGLPELILAPTDFSEASLPALQQAATLARQWGARLLIAHVIEPVAQVYGIGSQLAGGEVYWIEPEALAPEWRQLLSRVPLANVRWEQVTIKGFAVEALVALAAERQAGLIVIGTHGRSALPHALLGSVAEGVARRAQPCVLTVRHDAFTFRLP